MKKELIGVVMQAFYGNRTYVKVDEEDIDAMLQGYIGSDWKKFGLRDDIDRTIVKLPGFDCVLVYNRHQEARELKEKERYFREDGYVMKPLAVVPELGLEIYSRCFLCRVDGAGCLISVQDEDAEAMRKYLAP